MFMATGILEKSTLQTVWNQVRLLLRDSDTGKKEKNIKK